MGFFGKFFRKKDKINPNGLNEIYFRNGDLFLQFYQEEGNIVPPYKKWYKNGQLKLEIYKNWETMGRKEWYEDGGVKKIMVGLTTESSPPNSYTQYYTGVYMTYDVYGKKISEKREVSVCFNNYEMGLFEGWLNNL